MEFKNSLQNSDRKMHGTSYSKEGPSQESRMQGHIQKQVKRKSDIGVQECDLDAERMFYPFRCWTGCGSASVFYHTDLKLISSKLSSEIEEFSHLNLQNIQGGHVKGPGHYQKGGYKRWWWWESSVFSHTHSNDLSLDRIVTAPSKQQTLVLAHTVSEREEQPLSTLLRIVVDVSALLITAQIKAQAC